MTSGAGAAPRQPATPHASPTADSARAAQPESIDDYLHRLAAAAPRITSDHPVAALLIEHFKEQPAPRKTA